MSFLPPDQEKVPLANKYELSKSFEWFESGELNVQNFTETIFALVCLLVRELLE